MRSLLLASLAAVLAAPPLFAETRIARSTATPTEAVKWTSGVPITYDSSGNVRQIGNDRFVYDRVGRLVRAEVNGVTRTYTYDAFGNRTACAHVVPGTTTEGDCQFDIEIDSASNRMKDVPYDGLGNVEVFAGHRYTYDDVNMVKRDDGTTVREFIYTADDQRIATVSSTWNWTIRGLDGQVLREFTSNAGSGFTWKKDYVFRDGVLLASRHQAGLTPVTYHYHLDHLGTPRRVTDHTNRLVGFHDYFAFGPEVPGGLTEPHATSLQYTGHERDKSATGEGLDTLDYMHARYYSPAVGRFLSIDAGSFTAPLPQTWNRYTYVRNNPLKAVDPSGDETFLVIYGAGELSPTRRGQRGDVGNLFQISAETRKAQIEKSAAFTRGVDQVFLIHATNADEFYNAVNFNYPSGKIEGVEVFSHAWNEGLNLGGQGDRGIRSDNIGRLDLTNFASSATFKLWGCNAGSPVANGVPFAQQLANATGIPVQAHRGPTEFKQGGRGNPPMVPSNPKRGSLRMFNPQNPALLPLPKLRPAGACIEGERECA